MYCCNLLKPGLSITSKGWVSFTLTTVSYKLLQEHEPLQLPEKNITSSLKNISQCLFELIFSHQVGGFHPFSHFPVTNSCQEAPIPAPVEAIGYPGDRDQQSSAPLHTVEEHCNSPQHWPEPAVTETDRKRDFGNMYTLPARRAPSNPLHLKYSLTI